MPTVLPLSYFSLTIFKIIEHALTRRCDHLKKTVHYWNEFCASVPFQQIESSSALYALNLHGFLQIPIYPESRLFPIYLSQPRKLFPYLAHRIIALSHLPHHSPHIWWITIRMCICSSCIFCSIISHPGISFIILGKSCLYIPSPRIQDTAAIFGYPDNMVFRSIGSMPNKRVSVS